MRWRQKFNKETQTSEFVAIDESARKSDMGVSIHGVFEPFRSPVDRTIISTNKQLREHNLRNNVVCADEFSSEYYAKKAKERQDHAEGKISTAEQYSRRQNIYDIMVRAERDG